MHINIVMEWADGLLSKMFGDGWTVLTTRTPAVLKLKFKVFVGII